LANMYFRFFDVRLAEAVTHGGQLSIQWSIVGVNRYLNKILKTTDIDYIIASDTDSIYVDTGGIIAKFCKETDKQKITDFLAKTCKEAIQPFIDKRYQELADYVNAYSQQMEMKREVIADRGIWTGKKHYILNVYDKEGVRYDKPKLKITGIEAIKSSTPAVCRNKIKEALNIIMNGRNEELIQFVKTFREEFKSLPADEIAFPRGLTGLNEYKSKDKDTLCEKSTPIHALGAIIYNHYREKFGISKLYEVIREGDKIKFLYLKEPNMFQSHVIAFPSKLPKEFKLQEFIDYETQFNKAFVEPVKSILDCIGWQIEEIASLESFFG